MKKVIKDRDIIVSAKNGDKEALQSVLLQYERYIDNGLSELGCEYWCISDIKQNIFAKIGKNIKKLKNVEAFQNWLNKIILNTWHDYVKVEKIKQSKITNSLKMYSNDYKTIKPQEELLSLELSDKVFGAVLRLPYKYRIVILLRDYAKLGYNDISEIIGINKGTLKSRLSRARAIIKNMVEKYVKNG